MKITKEFGQVFKRIENAVEGVSTDASIPALTLHLSAAAVESGISPEAILDFVANTFMRTYSRAVEALPTQGGVQ